MILRAFALSGRHRRCPVAIIDGASQVHSNTMTDWGPPWLAMLVLNDVSKKTWGDLAYTHPF